MIIEAAAALAAKKARVDQLKLRKRGREPPVAVEGLKNRFGNRVVHVVADQVHQFERPHAKTAGVPHDCVDRRRVRRTFGKEPQRLGVVRPCYAIDDETRTAFCVYGDLSPCLRHMEYGRGGLRQCGETADHLHQLHHGRWIEEVHSYQSIGAPQTNGDASDREGRSIGREDSILRNHVFDHAEKRAFGRQVFNDRFNHQGGGCAFVQRLRCLDALQHRIRGFPRELSRANLPLQRLGRTGHRLRGRLGPAVVQYDLVAGGGRNLCDAASHGARPHHGDGAALGQQSLILHDQQPWNRGMRF